MKHVRRSSLSTLGLLVLLLVLVGVAALRSTTTYAAQANTTATWQLTGSMNTDQTFSAAIRLKNGKVLAIDGGWTAGYMM